MMKVSQLSGRDIFNDKGKYQGKVFDAIIDLQKGEVVRLTMEPIKSMSKDDARRIFQEKTILYKSVKAVDNIIILSTDPLPAEDTEEAEPMEEKKSPYSFASKYRKL